jgi:hypothetical protein
MPTFLKLLTSVCMKKLYAEEKILNCNTVISLVKIIQEEMQHSKEYTLQLRSFLDILL